MQQTGCKTKKHKNKEELTLLSAVCCRSLIRLLSLPASIMAFFLDHVNKAYKKCSYDISMDFYGVYASVVCE